MRRTILTALIALSGLCSQALAQSQGTIYFVKDSIYYAVDGNETGLATLPLPLQTLSSWPKPSGRSDYPGGRRFASEKRAGTIPNTTTSYDDVVVHDQAGGNQVQVTAFRGPQYVTIGMPQWSNDGQDTFLAFQAWEPATGRYYVYRAHVTGDDITSPGFVPLVPGDPRLELVVVSPGGYVNFAFNGGGTRLFYVDRWIPTPQGTTTGARVKLVGSDPSVPGDLLFTQASSGLGIGDVTYSPTGEQVVARGVHANGTKGLVSINPLNGAWSWLQTEWSSTTKGVTTSFTDTYYPQFSPDGTGVVFQAKVAFSKKDVRTLVVKCPASGGTTTTVAQFTVVGNAIIQGWEW